MSIVRPFENLEKIFWMEALAVPIVAAYTALAVSAKTASFSGLSKTAVSIVNFIVYIQIIKTRIAQAKLQDIIHFFLVPISDSRTFSMNLRIFYGLMTKNFVCFISTKSFFLTVSFSPVSKSSSFLVWRSAKKSFRSKAFRFNPGTA